MKWQYKVNNHLRGSLGETDFDKKIIKLESNVNLGEFYDKIKNILDDWKGYKLETSTTINWNVPVVTKEYIPHRPFIPQPWYEVTNTPLVTYCQNTGTKNYEL